MSIVLLDNFLILTVLLTSILVATEDIKTKRIPNKFILSAAAIGVFFYMIALLVGVIDFTYFVKIMVNTIISFIVSFGIWKLGLWPAGDAKLVITFSFLIPLQCYAQTYLSPFPSFVFLINICFVYLSFLAIKAVPAGWCGFLSLRQRGCFRQKILMCRLRRKWKAILRLASIKKHTWISGVVKNKNTVWKVLGWVFAKIFIISMAAMFFEKRSFQFRSFLIYFLFFGSLKILFRLFMDSYGRKRVGVSEIQPGANLSEVSIRRLRSDNAFFNSLDTLRPEGLTQHQAGLIRAYFSAKGIVSVYVHDTIPFSPFIILGAAATVLTKGSVLYLIGRIMGQISGGQFGLSV